MSEEQQQSSVLERAAKSYQESVNEIAKKGIYEFEYVDGPRAGEKVRLERHKISIAKMTELEKLRGEYSVSMMSGDGINTEVAKKARLEASTLLSSIYKKCAEYYFHIAADDFVLMDWDTSKANLDAASNISIFGRPN
jgi:hypothetical protein